MTGAAVATASTLVLERTKVARVVGTTAATETLVIDSTALETATALVATGAELATADVAAGVVELEPEVDPVDPESYKAGPGIS